MSDIDVARLRSLAEAATPGPWRRTDSGDRHWLRDVRDTTNRGVAWCGTLHVEQAHADAAYIAAANPQTMLAILDRIAELERTAAAAGRALKEAQAQEREAVAWIEPHEIGQPHATVHRHPSLAPYKSVTVPLYLAPPPAPAVPEEWVMVPREPTRDMLNAFHAHTAPPAASPCEVWTAMIAAAPPPPQQGE